MKRKQRIKDKIYELDKQLSIMPVEFGGNLERSMRIGPYGNMEIDPVFKSYLEYREMRAYKLALEWIISDD